MPEDTKIKAEDEQQVVQNVTERLKFFFSDANVRQDFFLRKFLVKTEKEEGDVSSPGTIPIETLLRFNTIKKYTTDPAMIVKVVKEHLVDKLVLKDEDKSIARVKPFTKDLMSDNIPVSLYLKNLPTKELENQGDRKIVQYATNVDELRKLFDQYGDVAIVRMRFKRSEKSDDEQHMDDIHHKDDSPNTKQTPRRRYPTGHCVVEFDNKEAFEKAVADVLTLKDGEKLDPKRKLEVGGNTLEVMQLQEYIDEVKKERESESKDRKRSRDDEGEEDKEEENEEEKLKNIEFTVDWKPACVVRIKGLPESCDREALVGVAATSMGVSVEEAEKKVRADYSRGQKNGAIRFFEPEDVGELVKKLKAGELEIAGTKDFEEVALLEGEEEKLYWESFITMRKRQILHRKEERGGPRNNRQKRRKGRDNNRNNNNRRN